MSKYVVQATWEDCPHLSEQQKADLMASMRPHQRQARMQGIPVLGAGAVYPVAEADITCAPFDIPKHWLRGYALDVGWNRTAALFGALDEQSDVLYIYSEHYQAEAEPPVHAEAIKARGAWLQGVVDPASRGRSQHDGERLYTRYLALGLNLTLADNAVEAGIDTVLGRMTTGRLKVFSTCVNFFYEFRLYRRDDKGKIVKKDDHLLDDLRYLCISGIPLMRPVPGAFGSHVKPSSQHQSEWDVFAALANEQAIR